MRKEERYKGVLNWFNENVPVAETELHYDNPYQLVAYRRDPVRPMYRQTGEYDHSRPLPGFSDSRSYGRFHPGSDLRIYPEHLLSQQ